MKRMAESLKQRTRNYIHILSIKLKWVLIILNIVLFYITFQYSAYIAFSMGRYAIFFPPRAWKQVDQYTLLAACAVAAAVFLGVAWRSMIAPLSVLQMIVLFAGPVAFYGIFGEMIWAMV